MNPLFPWHPPPPGDGHGEDAVAHLEAMAEHLDEEGAHQDDVAPVALGVIVLEDAGDPSLPLGTGAGDGVLRVTLDRAVATAPDAGDRLLLLLYTRGA